MADAPRSTGFSLRRWSQRKLAAGRGERDVAPAEQPVQGAGRPVAVVPPPRTNDREPLAPAAVPAMVQPSTAPGPATAQAPVVAPLPPIESLTIDSDFSPFMQPGVDENVKRMALRKLLRDPRFNVMDGLDVYIDDYSKPSPIEPALVRTLAQARYIFNPPRTRVTAEGNVEDVPDEVVADARDATKPDGQATPAPAIAAAPDAPTVTPAPHEPAESMRAPNAAEDAESPDRTCAAKGGSLVP